MQRMHNYVATVTFIETRGASRVKLGGAKHQDRTASHDHLFNTTSNLQQGFLEIDLSIRIIHRDHPLAVGLDFQCRRAGDPKSLSEVHIGLPTRQPNMEGMFAGQKFWFSNTVPQRSRFMEEVKANSGEVVPLEKQADICLYDHARKNPPPGMYSYRYVEHSVRKGQREDLEAHRIGGVSSRAERPVGSVTLASKGARIPFTEADDQMLWDWLKPIDGLRGSAGNAIYQQLEKENPRHTYQSWRDRWLKYVQFQKRELSGSGQRQRIAAQAVEHQTTPKEKRRETNVDVKCADPSPRIVVEVPVRDSPGANGAGHARPNVTNRMMIQSKCRVR